MSKEETHAVSTLVPVIAEGATLGVVGAGVMGTDHDPRPALERVDSARAHVGRRQERLRLRERRPGSSAFPSSTDYAAHVPTADLILMCVKPNDAPVVLATLRNAGLRSETLLISILAGVATDRLESLLGTENPVDPRHAQYARHRGRGHDRGVPRPLRLARRPAARPAHLRGGGQVRPGGRGSLQRHHCAERQRPGIPVPHHGGAGRCRRARGVAAPVGPHAGGPDGPRRGPHGADHRAPPGRPARRCDHPGGVHHRRAADAGGRTHPLRAGPRGGGGH